jgi:hypothetical protein
VPPTVIGSQNGLPRRRISTGPSHFAQVATMDASASSIFGATAGLAGSSCCSVEDAALPHPQSASTHHSRMATVTRAPLYCGVLATRPIIRLVVPGDTAEDFKRTAISQLGRDFFVASDEAVSGEIRVDVPFKSGVIAVRAEATATPVTRHGRAGAIIRLTKLEAGSLGVPLPTTPSTAPAEELIEVKRRPEIATGRTTTAHVVRRAATAPPAPDDGEVIEAVAEFESAAVITKNSPVSADLAKQLNEPASRPTPPGMAAVAPPAAPAPRTPAIIRRATPPVGVPAMVAPKPVLKSTTRPSTPPLDDDWSSDALTFGGPVRPAPASAAVTPPAGTPNRSSSDAQTPPSGLATARSTPSSGATAIGATPSGMAAVKPPPTPPKGLPSSIGARAPGTPRGEATFGTATPTKAPLDDDAAFDDAFDIGAPEEDAAPAGAKSVPPVEPAAVSTPAPSPGPSSTAATAKPRASTDRSIAAGAKPRASTDASMVATKPVSPAPVEPAGPAPTTVSGSAKPRASTDASLAAKSVSPAPVEPASTPETVAPARSSSPAPVEPAVASTPAATAKPRAPLPSPTSAGIGSARAGAAKSVSVPPVEPPSAAPVASTDLPTAPIATPGTKPRAAMAPPIAAAAKPVSVAPVEPAPPTTPAVGANATADLTPPTIEPPPPAPEILPAPTSAARGSVVSVTDYDARPRAVSEHAAPRRRSKLPLIGGAVAALVGVIVVIVMATRGGGPKPAPPQPSANQAEVDRHLRDAVARIHDGKLVGAGGDAALDHLLAAKQLAPGDPQVKAQLQALADTFEKLGDGAAASNDLAEAAAHFQAAISAEPDRASAKTKLEAVEQRARSGGR